MWETICDAQAGFWLNSKFLSKFSRKPLSGISDRKAPLQWKTSDLRWPKFTPEYPPLMKNFRFEMTKVYSGIPPLVLESGRSYVETNLYPPWIPLVWIVYYMTLMMAVKHLRLVHLRSNCSFRRNFSAFVPDKHYHYLRFLYGLVQHSLKN